MAPSLFSLLLSGVITEAARVSHSVASSSSASASVFSVLEDVAFAGGRLKANASSVAHVDAKNCPWHDDFDRVFKNKRVVGSGATACVYLAENTDGQTVAVKVGKGGEGESLSQWVEECKSMQLLRVDACKSSKRANIGDTLYNLNAQYIPTCLDIGSKTNKAGKEINYYVMHAAGTLEIKDIGNQFTVAERKSLFAQLVGAVWALHGLNTGHNDLHGGNILISTKTGAPRLALIDFGELSTPLDPTQPSVPPSTTWLFDYKRDGNGIMAWSSLLADCPAIPEFPVVPPGSELRARAKEFAECLKTKWNADDETIKAMEALMDKNSRQFPAQGVGRLFKSPMVQKNLPKFEPTYKWDKTGGCTAWPINKIMEFRRETEFSAMYRCETVPTYNKVQWKTRKDGRKVKKTSQNCKFARSACYTLIKDVTWSCDAGTIKGSPCDSVHLSKRSGHPDKTFDGGCLTAAHTEGYKYAKVYPGYVAPKPEDMPKRPVRTFTPLVTTTKRPVVKCDPNLPPKCKCSKTGTVRSVVTGKPGCKFHLSRSYGAFCYIEGGEECSGAKFSEKKSVYFRNCSPQCEKK
jgi:serine/threonine protein kinase